MNENDAHEVLSIFSNLVQNKAYLDLTSTDLSFNIIFPEQVKHVLRVKLQDKFFLFS